MTGLRPSGEMTAELKHDVARAILGSCKRNGAADADIGVILTLAFFEHLDDIAVKYGPPDAILDGMIFACQLRRAGQKHEMN